LTGADPFRLDGGCALVTGSSRGLGAAIARGLARAGAHVIVHGTDAQRAEAAAQTLREEGLSAGAAGFDVADAAAVRHGIADLRARGEVPTIIVNNAGINLRHPLAEFPDEAWRKVMAIHIDGAYHVVKAAVGPMLEAGRGKIINVCSLTSEVARPNISAYATAKGGLLMMTRAMATEWAVRGLQCNAIAPGFFATDMNRPLMEDEAFDAWVRKRTPAGRWGRPEDLAGAAVFLASPASDYVNGHMLAVDGGFLASM